MQTSYLGNGQTNHYCQVYAYHRCYLNLIRCHDMYRCFLLSNLNNALIQIHHLIIFDSPCPFAGGGRCATQLKKLPCHYYFHLASVAQKMISKCTFSFEKNWQKGHQFIWKLSFLPTRRSCTFLQSIERFSTVKVKVTFFSQILHRK